MKKSKKTKLIIYQVIFVIIAIITIITAILIVMKYKQRMENENKNKEILQELVNNETNSIEIENNTVEMDGVKVIGIIKIPKINLEYPILEKTTKHTMNMSISRFSGGNVNDYGNLALAGHNNRDGTMFGKTKNLQKGDIIELTNLNNLSINYTINDIFNTTPDDVSILTTKAENIREVTLITCTNGNKQRLIIKAIEEIK